MQTPLTAADVRTIATLRNAYCNRVAMGCSIPFVVFGLTLFLPLILLAVPAAVLGHRMARRSYDERVLPAL